MTQKNITSKCPIRTTLEMIGGKWKLLLIHHIGQENVRYGELKRRIPEISEKMLAQELRRLVADDLVSRKNYGEVPPRVEYSLTEKGEWALALIEPISQFGLQYLESLKTC